MTIICRRILFVQLQKDDLETDPNNSGLPYSGLDVNNNGILEVSYPNSYNLPNIISVASININNELASTSNYGITEVDIAAPGEFIFSTINGEFIERLKTLY